MESPILKHVKRHLNVAISFPATSLYHEVIIGLKPLWQLFAIMNITNWIDRLNDNSAASITSIIRIK